MIRFFKLLPCGEDEVPEFVFDYLKETHKQLAQLADKELPEAQLRWRLESLPARLGMLNTILSAYRQKMDWARNKFMQSNPRPEKGVTLWEERRSATTLEEQRICEHVEAAIKSIETRVSTTQSNLKSLGKES